MLLIIVNHFVPILYYVDENNVYNREISKLIRTYLNEEKCKIQ